MTVGKRLAKIRGEESQTEFAKRFGISQNGLSRYERGERPPSFELLTYLSNQGFSVDWLLTGRGEMVRPPEPDMLFGGVDCVAIERSVFGRKATPNPLQIQAQLDLQQLQEALEAVKEGLESMDRKVPAAKEAALASHVFGLLRKKAGFGEVLRYLRTATEA